MTMKGGNYYETIVLDISVFYVHLVADILLSQPCQRKVNNYH